MFFGNALRGYISYTKQKAVTYQHQIHTDPRNSCKSVPLNTTRNKECLLRWLEIRYPASWLFWYSSSAPQRVWQLPEHMHAWIQGLALYRMHPLLKRPHSSSDTKSLLQMKAHLFQQGLRRDPPTRAALFPKCRHSALLVIRKKLGTEVNVDA